MHEHRPMDRSLLLLTAALLLPPTALAEPTGSSGGVQALYPTKAAAEKAAKHFHCTGAHQMGDKWMPCAQHGNGHGSHTPAH
jgi:hypothetical protein